MENQVTPFETHLNRITFFLNGEKITADIPAGLSTLDWLHTQKQLYGTKCSCNEGDCGACTVVIAYPFEGIITYQAITSCLYPTAKLHGKHLITIEGLGTPEKLHPIQQALLTNHAIQCGYCTPGLVMSLFALFAMQPHPDREMTLAALEGNLCRCGTYQSILNAVDELATNQSVKDIVPAWCREVEKDLFRFTPKEAMLVTKTDIPQQVNCYLIPTTTKQLFDLYAEHPESVFIAGGTDIMVQKNINRKEFPFLIDLTQIPELNRLYLQQDGLHIGSAVTYNQLWESGIVKTDFPVLHNLISQIASRQIRNLGTLGGNIANASPVGDTIPLLMVLNASLWLQSNLELRHLPLKDFFLGYHKTALQKGEIIKEIIIPPLTEDNYVKTIKSAKRKSVDISSVITAVNIEHKNGRITNSALAIGGVAALPLLSRKFPKLLKSKQIKALDPAVIIKEVESEFEPLTDIRGTALFRRELIRNHLILYLQELQEEEK
jgi:xanthine dehydrogenase small subunit